MNAFYLSLPAARKLCAFEATAFACSNTWTNRSSRSKPTAFTCRTQIFSRMFFHLRYRDFISPALLMLINICLFPRFGSARQALVRDSVCSAWFYIRFYFRLAKECNWRLWKGNYSAQSIRFDFHLIAIYHHYPAKGKSGWSIHGGEARLFLHSASDDVDR